MNILSGDITETALIIYALKPVTRRYWAGSRARPCHAIAHDGGGIAIVVKIGINTPVFHRPPSLERRSCPAGRC